jgi:deazaflavin-dependent oxidoreductase (nitroreductase family)|tara:strand:- start:158 stop:601 length:444 start_codon:yes stop_codon:yes gene_type:complete
MSNEGPSIFQLKAMNFIHRMLIRLSFGRAGWNAAKMPVIKLTTTGRKSGLPRSVMLTSPYKENDSLIIVASKGGSDTPPDWLLNLEKKPDVTVSIQGAPSVAMHAEVVDENERNRLWPLITKDYSNYGDYQTKTSRVIPLIFLRPAR